ESHHLGRSLHDEALTTILSILPYVSLSAFRHSWRTGKPGDSAARYPAVSHGDTCSVPSLTKVPYFTR
ncbi:MAG: hypothetical protein ABR903_06825, partial [Thermodesulfovibrionales bacterium]